MKKLFITIVGVLVSFFFLQAQKPTSVKPKAAAKVTPPTPQIVLKNLEDSANYAIGISVGSYYKSQGVKSVNSSLLKQGITDVMSAKTLILDDGQCSKAINDYMAELKNPKPKKQAPPPVKTVNAVPLKTLADSANYAVGVSVANFYKIQGVTKINAPLVVSTIGSVLAGKKRLLTDEQCLNVINNYLTQLQVWKSKPMILAGEQFLQENKSKPGVVTTASGLQYEVLKEGTGPKPARADTVVCHYRGTFMNGAVFDESYSRGQPIEFAVTGVIQGWTEALLLMPVGSKYKLYVPYNLGYGINDYFAIPGGSLLIFEVELLSIKGKQ